ncbi:unnamed protein product, partial [Amoebophrya sp. A120]|eukprot:GSA120T00019735001.1
MKDDLIVCALLYRSLLVLQAKRKILIVDADSEEEEEEQEDDGQPGAKAAKVDSAENKYLHLLHVPTLLKAVVDSSGHTTIAAAADDSATTT